MGNNFRHAAEHSGPPLGILRCAPIAVITKCWLAARTAIEKQPSTRDGALWTTLISDWLRSRCRAPIALTRLGLQHVFQHNKTRSARDGASWTILRGGWGFIVARRLIYEQLACSACFDRKPLALIGTSWTTLIDGWGFVIAGRALCQTLACRTYYNKKTSSCVRRNFVDHPDGWLRTCRLMDGCALAVVYDHFARNRAAELISIETQRRATEHRVGPP
jgi:hypothetical protein